MIILRVHIKTMTILDWINIWLNKNNYKMEVLFQAIETEDKVANLMAKV
jgi:hypothetical protein